MTNYDEATRMDQHPQPPEASGTSVTPGAAPQDRPDAARRSFLKAAPLGALAVVAGNGQAADTPAPAPAQADPQGKRGYHETDHIRRYYQTAAYW